MSKVATMVLGLVLLSACQRPAAEGLPCDGYFPCDMPGSDPVTKAGSVMGRVVDAGTQQGLAGAVVSVRNVDPPITTSTAGDGSFTLAAVPQGQQILDVDLSGYEAARPTWVNVLPQATTTASPIPLTKR